jgi:hypothetical protein
MHRAVFALGAALALSGCGGGSNSNESVSVPLPPSPANLVAETAAGDVALAWDSVDGADGYHLYYAEEPDIQPDNYAAFEGGAWVQNVQPPYMVTGLAAEPVYHFVVTAFDGNGESQPSNEVIAIPRYVISGDNNDVVRDMANGLEWKRCTEGQTWSDVDGYCAGNPTVFEDGAAINIQQADGFRTPTRDELASLLFCSSNEPAYFPNGSSACYGGAAKPAIVAHIFPSTPYARYFQTSTKHPSHQDVYSAISFESGFGVSASKEGSLLYVRLVRPMK